jgi:dephospho-CoA kinase
MAETGRRLRRWVVTGPAGAGKSLATAALADLGAHVVDADAEGHAVLREPAVAAEIADAFGPDCVADGEVRRDVLGPRVFADRDALARLNRITHGRLSARLAARLDDLEAAADEPGLAVVEAAVYFLLPPIGPVDLVIAVTAPPEQRQARLVSAGLDAAAARARIDAQAEMLPAYAGADVVLANTGTEDELRRAVAALHGTYASGDSPGG